MRSIVANSHDQWPYEVRNLESHGGPVRVQVIRCSSGDCNAESYVLVSKKHPFPPEFLRKKFSKEGWKIPKKVDKSICPKCVQGKEQSKNQCEADDMGKNIGSADSGLHPEDATATREPSRSQKREIVEALNDYYDSNAERYTEGMTDQELGRLLDLPWRWIADIRDDLFGPEGGNEEIDKFHTAVQGLESMVKNWHEELNEILVKGEELFTRCNELKKMGEEIKKRLES